MLPRFLLLGHWEATLSLLLWPLVTLVCAFLLVRQTSLLLTRHRGQARWLAAVPFIAFVTIGVLAYFVVTMTFYLSGTFSCLDCSFLNVVVTHLHLTGASVVGVTVVALLVVSVARRRVSLPDSL